MKIIILCYLNPRHLWWGNQNVLFLKYLNEDMLGK